jgi:HSP20 family protein
VQRQRRFSAEGQTGGEYTPPLMGLSPLTVLSMSPFDLMRRMLTDDMDQIFFGPAGRPGGGRPMQARTFIPQIETFQRNDELVVRADLPGVTPDQINVTVDDDTLIIEGERRAETQERRGGAYVSERVYGMFRREIPLPTEARQDAIRAQFDNGVLELSIPLDEQRRRGRRIAISGASQKPGGGGGAQAAATGTPTASATPPGQEERAEGAQRRK